MRLPAIKVEGLSKKYRIGERESYKTFREAIANFAKVPFRRWNGFSSKSAIRSSQSESVWALKDVSFKVQPGEVVGIIGRNGAGKSTLLKVLSKITKPTTGRVEIRGRVGSLLEIGTGFHPELTGHENIYLYGAILGMDRWEVTRKFDEIVAFAELEKFIDTPVKRYSSGMYMRLAFAVAAHLDLEVLLVDEVLSVGDMAFQKKCIGKMSDVISDGRTILFVSHNIAAIRKLCNKGLLIESGKIIERGQIAACLDKYLAGDIKQNRLIKDHINKRDQTILIDSVLVNDYPYDRFNLPADARYLKIEFSGEIDQPARLDIEAEIHDLYSNPLSFFSPGHERGYNFEIKPGKFRIIRYMELPRIMHGEFIMSIHLTTPNIRSWVEIPNALRIVAEGTPMPTGQVFDYYQQRKGWVFLTEASIKIKEN